MTEILLTGTLTQSNIFLFSNKMMVIIAGIHIMLVRKANRRDPTRLLLQNQKSALFV